MRRVPGCVCARAEAPRERLGLLWAACLWFIPPSPLHTAHAVPVCTYECASLHISVGIHVHISSATLGGIILLSIRHGAQQ